MRSPVPSSMRAAAIDRFGGVEELRTRTLPVPQLGPREVLIRVQFAGVGAWDLGEREGRYSELFRELHGVGPAFPYVIGFDGAGTVAAAGEAVTRFVVGDRVYADRHLNPKGGFHAEYAAIDVDRVHSIPAGLSTAEAGAMPVDAITALLGLDDALDLQPGESVLIFGASGGLGHLAVQLAKRGRPGLAVASGDDGVALAGRLGADGAVAGALTTLWKLLWHSRRKGWMRRCSRRAASRPSGRWGPSARVAESPSRAGSSQSPRSTRACRSPVTSAMIPPLATLGR